MKNRMLVLVLCACTTCFTGCDEAKPQPPLTPPQPAARPAAPAGTPAPVTSTPNPSTSTDAGREVSLLGVTLLLPETWKRNPPANQMRLAEAEVPPPSGDPAAACIVVFSTAGGSVKDNIDRWIGQVRDAQGNAAPSASDTRVVNGVNVTVMESSGFFQGMGDASPRPNWALRGAVIEAPGGLLFAKMTGPASSITAAAPAFDAMIGSITKR